MGDGSLWKWPRTSRNRAVMFWRPWVTCINMMRRARSAQLSPPDRLQFHQQHSGPVMEQLHQWLEAQFALKQVEPNSGLGKAITYLLRHWKGLTAFLREAGAPLDNNICERALKRDVL